MAESTELINTLNDLILINNDRIVGYEKAIKDLDHDNTDLKEIFSTMAGQSQGYQSDLKEEVVALGGEVADGTTNAGKIYRAWMDIKATFSGDDRQTALNNCEFGEDAAQKAYKEALNDTDIEMTSSSSIREILVKQKAELKVSHDKIRAMRDANKED